MFDKPEDIILFVLAVAVLVVFAGCIYAFFRAIFFFIFSKGDDATIKKARNSIRYMVIGIFLVMTFLFIAPQVMRLFKVQNYQEYNAKNIFIKIGTVITSVGEVIGIMVRDYPKTRGIGLEETDTRDTTAVTYQL